MSDDVKNSSSYMSTSSTNVEGDIDVNDMKRADKRSSMTILVLGDVGVGKSSLIATFVSRFFPDDVPGILTTVRLPPETLSGPCTTIIADSQRGDASLLKSVSTKRINLSSVALSPSEFPSSLFTLINTAQNEISTVNESGDSESIGNQGCTIKNVDSIVLVYDVNRLETLDRLDNHWLPLIEYCYDGKIPVTIAENKVDLVHSKLADEATASGLEGTIHEDAGRKTKQIVSLMQRFRFIRQCIPCSAKSVQNVDDVFIQAQRNVLYPFPPPLYNLETDTMSVECERAITRIFRILDIDHDSLLSDSELHRLLSKIFDGTVSSGDISHLRKVILRDQGTDNASVSTSVSATIEPALKDDKFTAAGFKQIFDTFIEQNQYDVVWQILRRYGYDDEINLQIPDSFNNSSDDVLMECWKLSSKCKKFLTNIFVQFDSDGDGVLSPDDLLSIFSIISPPALPPWHPRRAFELFDKIFSRPKQSIPSSDQVSSNASIESDSSPPTLDLDSKNMADSTLIIPEASTSSPPTASHSLLSHTGLSILSESDALPSIDVGGMYPLSKSLSFFEWMGHWHALAAISAPITRAELFRLGYVKDYNRGLKGKTNRNQSRKRSSIKKSGHWLPPPPYDLTSNVQATVPKVEISMKSHVVHVLVLGKTSCGKTALLNVLCGAQEKRDGLNSSSSSPCSVRALETSPTNHPETSATFVKLCSSNSRSTQMSGSTNLEIEENEFVVHLVFTEIPESDLTSNEAALASLLAAGAKGSTLSSANDGDIAFDVVMFVLDCCDTSSFDFVKLWESRLLSDDIPRLYVCTKLDKLGVTVSKQQQQQTTDCVHEKVKVHCEETDLEPPVLTSVTDMLKSAHLPKNSRQSMADFTNRENLLIHISRCALTGEAGILGIRSRPHEEQKRKDSARRRTIMWFGGIAAVVVAVGVGLLWGSSSPPSNKSKDQKSNGSVVVGGLSWLRSFFTYSSSAPPRVT